MALTSINQNIASLNAQRNLNINSTRLQSSVERLSSGLRINRGADDPSGLIVSEMLRAQVSSLDVAGQNALQGVNLIKTAEGALNEVNGLLRQARDLAVSASSDSNNTDASRAALQQRLTSAFTTLDSIASTTSYGGRKLLDGSAGTKSTVADTTHVASASLNLGTETAGWADVHVTAAAEKATVSSNAAAVTTAATTFAADMTKFDAGDEVGLYINGTKVGIAANGQNGNIGDATTWQDIVDSVTAQQSALGVTATATAGGTFSVTSLEFGADQHVSVEFRKVTDGGGDMDISEALSGAGEDLFASDAGVNAAGHAHFAGGAQVDFTTGSGLTLGNATHGSIQLSAAGNAVAEYNSAVYTEQGELSFQIGINAGETASMAIRDCHTAELGKGVDGTYTSLAALDISTVDGASAALAVIDSAIGEVSQLRGDLGAFQSNELEAQSRSLSVARENLAASESAIRDTDFGKEMSEYTTAQIMVQASMSFLSQANGLPNNVLSLIRG
ncbi:MAG: flagellin N-terminal helical domain-containing protein [Armatimonadota bacterium]